MEIYTYLKKDHRKVSALFKQLIAASKDNTRVRIQNKIINEILIHASTEQITFYNKLKKYDKSKKLANHGVSEHKDIKKCIKTLIKEEVGTTDWLKAVKKLKKTVDHHVKEEEGPMFSKARQVLTKEQELNLTEQMKKKKKLFKKKLKLAPKIRAK